MENSCYKCVHRASLPGNCHSRCRNVSAKVKMNPHGVQNGWGCWPIDYDPIWVESCDRWSDNPDDFHPGEESDPMMALLSMLGRSC